MLNNYPAGKLICVKNGKYTKWFKSIDGKTIYVPKKATPRRYGCKTVSAGVAIEFLSVLIINFSELFDGGRKIVNSTLHNLGASHIDSRNEKTVKRRF